MTNEQREDIDKQPAHFLRTDLREAYLLIRSRESRQRVNEMISDDVLLKRAQDRLDELNQQENEERAAYKLQAEREYEDRKRVQLAQRQMRSRLPWIERIWIAIRKAVCP